MSIQSLYDLPADAIDADMQTEGFLLVHVESLMNVSVLASGHLARVRYAAFLEDVRRNKAVAYRFSPAVPAVLRIIREADLDAYKQTANDNYRAAYGGNPRSGELDRTRNWKDASAFPRLFG